MVYLDTSVITPIYCPEPNSDHVEQIVFQYNKRGISQLTGVELASAISSKVRENAMSRSDGNRIMNRFQSHVNNHSYTWIPVQADHFRTAKTWIAQYPDMLRTLDALHIAIADTENLTFLTLDMRLAESASMFGVKVRLIEA